MIVLQKTCGMWYATTEEIPGFFVINRSKRRLVADVSFALRRLAEICPHLEEKIQKEIEEWTSTPEFKNKIKPLPELQEDKERLDVEALRLRRSGMKYKEIAKKMGISEARVYQRVLSAKHRILHGEYRMPRDFVSQ